MLTLTSSLLSAARPVATAIDNPTWNLGLLILQFALPVMVMNVIAFAFVRTNRLLRATPAVTVFLPTLFFLVMAAAMLLLGLGDWLW